MNQNSGAEDYIRWYRAFSSPERAARLEAELKADMIDEVECIVSEGSLDSILELFESFAAMELTVEEESFILCGPLESAVSRADLGHDLVESMRGHELARIREWVSEMDDYIAMTWPDGKI